MTTTTLRPDATIVAPTAVTGASAHAATSDDSDASYVSQQGGEFRLTLTTVALPTGAVTKSLVARLRGRSSGQATVQLYARLSASGAHLGEAALIVPAFNVWTDRAGAAAGVSLTQTEINDLEIGFTGGAVGFPVDVAELYLDLTYALQPVVLVTAPAAPVTTTTTPAVTWTYTPGSDGGTQARYEVKIFNAAQYGAGGFDPSSSTPTDTGGVVLSSATSAVTGILPNGTYRAYVRAAQTINGSPHWSEWSYSAFTVAVVTADVLDVTATGDPSNGRMQIVVNQNEATPAWVTLDVERSIDGGTTWVAVRGQTGTTPTALYQWVGYDYEVAPNTLATYRARAIYTAGSTIVGPWTSSAPAQWITDETWLKDTYNTSRNRVVTVNSQPGLTYPKAVGVLRPLGREDPVVISDVRQLPSGSVVLYTLEPDEYADLLALVKGADVLLLQVANDDLFGSRYVFPLDIEEIRPADVEAEPGRYWRIPFVEVLAPVDIGISITGLTWQDIVDTYATWQDVVNAFPTWGDLL